MSDCSTSSSCSCSGAATAPEAYEFDARGVSRRFRHAAIFGALESLNPGETMRFLNDHDPLPLLVQLREYFGQRLDIAYIARAPGEVVIDFRIAA